MSAHGTADLDADLVAQGYQTWDGFDPFENRIGAFGYRKEPHGMRCVFRAQPHHCNSSGNLHGGLLMTFADFSLFIIAKDALDGQHGVTASFNGDFVGAVGSGSLVEATGEVVKSTRSLIFVRGLMTSGDKTLFSYSGLIKKIKPQA